MLFTIKYKNTIKNYNFRFKLHEINHDKMLNKIKQTISKKINDFRRKKQDFLDLKLENRINNGLNFSIWIGGGLGVQILNYGLFKYLQEKKFLVNLDLSYFDKPASRAKEGNKGAFIHRAWELDFYGVNINTLKNNYISSENLPTLGETPLKIKLIYEAFQNKNIKKIFDFKESDNLTKKFREINLKNNKYVCIHARRGDFLNFASHLISEDQLEKTALKFKEIYSQIVLLSDTKVKNSEFVKLRQYYGDNFHILDEEGTVETRIAHSIMRNSGMLICSNSTFSLSAGLLSNGIVLMPKIWFGKTHEKYNSAISSFFEFGLVK
jgi:hypothetical protein